MEVLGLTMPPAPPGRNPLLVWHPELRENTWCVPESDVGGPMREGVVAWRAAGVLPLA